MAEINVERIDLSVRLAFLSDGRSAEIIQLLNCRGETTHATCEAVAGVAEAGKDEFYAFEVFPRERAM